MLTPEQIDTIFTEAHSADGYTHKRLAQSTTAAEIGRNMP